MRHVSAWLAAVLGSLTTLSVAGIGFHQWRRSERRQLDQLEVAKTEQELKRQQFTQSMSDPYRAKRASALEELLQRLTELESIVRLAHKPDENLSEKLHGAYSTLIVKRSLLTGDEISSAQSYISNLYEVHAIMQQGSFSTTPFGEQFPETNENSTELTEAAPYFSGIRMAHMSLAQSLREALGDRPATP